MPVIKSAKKQMRQNAKRRARNFPVRSELKTVVKNQLKRIKDGKVEEAVKFMAMAYSVIDTAVKKNIIHKNNAARKKSLLARGLNDLVAKGGKVEVAEKAGKKAPVKKAAKVEKAEEEEVKEEASE